MEGLPANLRPQELAVRDVFHSCRQEVVELIEQGDHVLTRLVILILTQFWTCINRWLEASCVPLLPSPDGVDRPRSGVPVHSRLHTPGDQTSPGTQFAERRLGSKSGLVRRPQQGRLLEQARRLYFLLPQPKACLEFLSHGIDGF